MLKLEVKLKVEVNYRCCAGQSNTVIQGISHSPTDTCCTGQVYHTRAIVW